MSMLKQKIAVREVKADSSEEENVEAASSK